MENYHYPYEQGPRCQPDDGRRTPRHGDPLLDAMRQTAATNAADADAALTEDLENAADELVDTFDAAWHGLEGIALVAGRRLA